MGEVDLVWERGRLRGPVFGIPETRGSLQVYWGGDGVAGGVRTLGHWNHNPALYRLSYSHRINDSVSRVIAGNSSWR